MKKYLVELLRIVILGLFVYTLYHKLIDLQSFETTLLKSSIIRPEFVQVLKFAVPLLEFIVVILLLSKNYINGFYSSFIVLLTFTLYLITLNNFSFYKGCSCGGIFNKLSYVEHIIINISFLIMCCLGIFIYPNEVKKDLD